MSGDEMEYDWLYDSRGDKLYKEGKLSTQDEIWYIENKINELHGEITRLHYKLQGEKQ